MYPEIDLVPRNGSEYFKFVSFYVETEVIHLLPSQSQQDGVQRKALDVDQLGAFEILRFITIDFTHLERLRERNLSIKVTTKQNVYNTYLEPDPLLW